MVVDWAMATRTTGWCRLWLKRCTTVTLYRYGMLALCVYASIVVEVCGVHVDVEWCGWPKVAVARARAMLHMNDPVLTMIRSCVASCTRQR